MRTVAVTNLKGGVGKTTTTVSLGAGLAFKGLRVLLVDVDAQGNLAMALGLQPRRTLYEVLVDGKPMDQCLTPARPNLDLLASDDALMTAQPLLAHRSDWAHLLRRALKSVTTHYDVVLIDCSPSMSILNASALLAATMWWCRPCSSIWHCVASHCLSANSVGGACTGRPSLSV